MRIDDPSRLQPTAPQKPLLRGRLHQVAFFVVIPAGVTLVVAAQGATARVSAAVYALSLAALYGTSAAYHRLHWSARGLRWMKRLDHSMIFVLIAGTYTPISLLVLPAPWSYTLLVVVWAGAIAGIVLKMVWVDGFRIVTAILYIGLGWAAVVAAHPLVTRLSILGVVLVVTGGLLYTVGAVVLLRKRPDPSPRVFGYHEVWHSMVIGASACHYMVIMGLVLAHRALAA